jgi:putative acetyltransferase
MVIEMDLKKVEIRRESPGDALQVRLVNELAFGGAAEAEVIDRLREPCSEFVSLVAVLDDRIIGHILFTPAVLVSNQRRVAGMGLAPLAVLPEYQNRGIGGELVRAGLLEMQTSACPFVIVLGHPGYYPRFGFKIASTYGIHSEYEGVPDEAFMIIVFDQGVMPPDGAVAYYQPEWKEAA